MLSKGQEALLDQDLALDIDIIGSPTDDLLVWELFGYLDSIEYLWSSNGMYAGSIGMNEQGRYFASVDDRYRANGVKDFTCIWYR